MKKTLIAPSILSADFSRLGAEIQDVEKGGCDIIHVDVMDGHFVPNLTIGPVVIQGIRKTTRLPLDVHLMIDEPGKYLEEYAKAGSDWLTVHYEACENNLKEILGQIKSLGRKRGVSIKPRTPASVLYPFLDEIDLILIMTVEPGFGGQKYMPAAAAKIAELRGRFSGMISVDGGINAQTSPEVIGLGADILVAGSAVFGKADRAQAMRELIHAS